MESTIQIVDEFIHKYQKRVYNIEYMRSNSGLVIHCETTEGSTCIRILFPSKFQECFVLEITGMCGTKNKVGFDNIENALYVVENYMILQALTNDDYITGGCQEECDLD